MPDTDPSTQPEAHVSDRDNPNHGEPATPSFSSLKEKLTSEFSSRQLINFPDYMEIVLYDPENGYYANQTQQVGRDGDFYTSVSVGPLFGEILAHRFLGWWKDNGKPKPWRLLELGGHDGKLAADILSNLARLSPEAWNGLQYASVEPLPKLRRAQRERLEPLVADLRIEANTSVLAETPLPGIIFGNELLDALPFHLVKKSDDAWTELFVSSDMEFAPCEIAPNSKLAAKLKNIGSKFDNGYQTEVRSNYLSFIAPLTECIEDGLILFIDYGFAAPEYYDSHRTSGTLRTFSRHKAAENPLERAGEIDITAHVDFTDLTLEMEHLGYYPTHFSSQGSYLTHLATDMIRSGDLDDFQKIAQFKTLTHPGHLGASFHAIEFSKQSVSSPEIRHRLAIE